MDAAPGVEIPDLGAPRHVDVVGRRVRYLDIGEGPPILLVHGWIGSAENFHKWLPALQGRRRMIVPDLPGFGETPALVGRHSITAMAAFLGEFASAIGVQEFDLGGLCLGATIALELARSEPDRVRQLVLHTPIYSRRAISRRFRVQMSAFLNPVVFPVASALSRSRRVSDIYKRFVVEGEGVDQFDAQVNFANQRRASPRAAREWLQDALRQEYQPWLLGWQKPVLMVVAGDDWLLDRAAMDGLAESMPHAEIVVVPDAGHGWTDALVQAQTRAISGFLTPA